MIIKINNNKIKIKINKFSQIVTIHKNQLMEVF